MAAEILLHPSYIVDLLYKRVEITPSDVRLFQTKELTRTRSISLSAQPAQILNAGMCDTRFNHSVGVAHLAKIVGKKEEFKEISKDFYLASLVHDVGHPPFSHTSEYFQERALGKNHEEVVGEILHGSELGKEITRQGGSIERITQLIQGKLPPFSEILNGSIDIDNMDNVLRYALSTGIFSKATYSPENISDSYALEEDKLIFLPGIESEIRGWEEARKTVYDFVDAPVSMSIAMMMFRGLGFAERENELRDNFFFMNDVEAFNYLKTKCNSRTRSLFTNIESWKFHQQVFEFATTNPSQNVKNLISNRDNRIVLADEISSELDIEPESISVYVGKSKGVRQIHVPISGRVGNNTVYQQKNTQKWMANVYVDASHMDKAPKIGELINSKLS